MYFYTVTIMKLTSRIYLPPGNRVTRLLGSVLWSLRFRRSVFSSGCLQAVTPCLGLVVTALMKKQREQPIMRFICPLGFSNMAVSQAQRYRFGCGVLWAPWPSEVTRPSVPGSGVSSVWSPWKLQSCAGGRSVCVPETERAEPDRRSPAGISPEETTSDNVACQGFHLTCCCPSPSPL